MASGDLTTLLERVDALIAEAKPDLKGHLTPEDFKFFVELKLRLRALMDGSPKVEHVAEIISPRTNTAKEETMGEESEGSTGKVRTALDVVRDLRARCDNYWLATELDLLLGMPKFCAFLGTIQFRQQTLGTTVGSPELGRPTLTVNKPKP
jgi:hypothetical protein